MSFFANAHHTNASHSVFNAVSGDHNTVNVSIATVLSITDGIIGNLRDVHKAPSDHIDLLIELSSISNLLTVLERRARGASPGDLWFAEIQKLAVQNGALDQFKSTLEQMKSKLRVANGPERLTWAFDKRDIKDTLDRIERLKTLVGIALAEDHLWVPPKTITDRH
jgi:hypothetical protein